MISSPLPHVAKVAKNVTTKVNSTKMVHRAFRDKGPWGVPRSYEDIMCVIACVYVSKESQQYRYQQQLVGVNTVAE